MVAPPNLTLTITPPGGSPTDYTRYLAYDGTIQQMTITQNFGRQGDTALLPLAEEFVTTPAVIIRVDSQIRLRDNIAGKTLFAGVVTDPLLRVTGPTRNEWELNATDYTTYADNAIVHGQYYGWRADDIIVDLTRQADCGISAARIQYGGQVAPAPVLASYIQNYDTLTNAWRKLAALASQSTPYGWYVDEALVLHFFDQTTAISSGVTFTTNPTVAGSTTEGHILLDSQFGYEWDGTSIRNRIMVSGATQTITTDPATKPPTDTWLADGTGWSWPLRFTVTGSPALQVNGVFTPVTVLSGGAAGTGAWLVEQNATGGWFLHAAVPPAAGTVIRIWYDYQVPVIAQANDAASQATYTGPNRGVYSEYISDTSLTTTPMALARAMRERTEYAFAAERITFDTAESFAGWVRAGQTCVIDCALVPDAQRGYAMGVNDTFLVTGNRVTSTQGGYRQCQVTAVRL